MTWTIRPLSRIAQAMPSTPSCQRWRIDLTLIRSSDLTLVREADHVLDLYSPFEDAISTAVLPSQWYLASPAHHLPLVFDIIHHIPTLDEVEGRQEATRFRLSLSHARSRGDLEHDTSLASAPALSVEMVSRFHFPSGGLSFMDRPQIPGWFSVQISPRPEFESTGSSAPSMSFIYEPGVGVCGNDRCLNPKPTGEPIDEAGKVEFGVVAGVAPLEIETQRGTRSVDLSMLYQGSVLGVGVCVSGRVAYACPYPPGGAGVCVLDQPLFPLVA